MINTFRANAFISQSTRALNIVFSFYNPSYDEWMAVDILIEFSVNGLVSPTFMHVNSFDIFGNT